MPPYYGVNRLEARPLKMVTCHNSFQNFRGGQALKLCVKVLLGGREFLYYYMTSAGGGFAAHKTQQHSPVSLQSIRDVI